MNPTNLCHKFQNCPSVQIISTEENDFEVVLPIFCAVGLHSGIFCVNENFLGCSMMCWCIQLTQMNNRKFEKQTFPQLSSSVQPTPTIRDGNDEKQIICQYFLYDADSIRTQRELIDNNQCNHIIEYDRITGKADSELFVTRDSDLRNDFYSLIPRWRESGIRVSIGIQMTCTFYEERVQETPVKRARFIQSIIEFMKRQSFDGFAIYRADEMCSLPLDANFMSFLSELSVALQSDGLSLAITTTNDALVRPEFDVKELSKYSHYFMNGVSSIFNHFFFQLR